MESKRAYYFFNNNRLFFYDNTFYLCNLYKHFNFEEKYVNKIKKDNKLTVLYKSEFIFEAPIYTIEYTNQDFPVEILNDQTEAIIFNYSFDRNLDNLPNTVKMLIFDNGEIDTFCDICEYSVFNRSLDGLVDSIKVLKLGDQFNQPIEKYPKSLTHLYFGNNFNQPLDNLPMGLEELGLSGYYNQTLENLPVSLKKLSIIGEEEPLGLRTFSQNLDFLPGNLEEFEFYVNDYELPMHNLPSSLKKLAIMYIGEEGIIFPEGLESLHISYVNEPLVNLPRNLKDIKLGMYYSEIDNFPDSLESIIIYSSDEEIVYNKKQFPNLKTLQVPACWKDLSNNTN